MKRKIIAIILIISSLVMVVVPSFAKTQEELNKERNTIKEKQKQTEKRQTELKAEKDKTLNEISNIEDSISDYETELSELNGKIKKLEEDISTKGTEIEKLEKEYDEDQKLLTDRLVAIYEQGPVTILDVFLSADDFMDVISLPARVKELTEADNAQMEKVEEKRQKVEKTKKELEENKVELDNSKKSVESKQKSLKIAKAEKGKKVSNLTEEQKKLQNDIEAYNKKVNELEVEIAKAAEAAKDKMNGQIHSGSGVLAWPLPYKAPITSPFGYRTQPIPGASSNHRGIDIGVPTGTRVLSAADGYVVDTGYNSIRGNYVMVKHADNLFTFYQHLNSYIVSRGQNVKRGQQIAYSGHSGIGTGPHLHFEVRTSASPNSVVNPMNYL